MLGGKLGLLPFAEWHHEKRKNCQRSASRGNRGQWLVNASCGEWVIKAGTVNNKSNVLQLGCEKPVNLLLKKR